MTHTVYIGLGSNLDNPQQHVCDALVDLDNIAKTTLVSHSPWYQSIAVGPAQPDYINGVAQLTTHLAPLELLDALQVIELNHRRVRKEHWGPRTLDLDILVWDNDIIELERLTIPHAFLTQRNFVLLPLYDLAPTLVLPNQQSIEYLLTKISLDGCNRLPNTR